VLIEIAELVFVALALRRIGHLDIGYREKNWRLATQALHELKLGDAMNVAFELEGFDCALAIDLIKVRIQKIGQRVSNDEEFDRSERCQTDKTDAITFGNPLAITKFKANAGLCQCNFTLCFVVRHAAISAAPKTLAAASQLRCCRGGEDPCRYWSRLFFARRHSDLAWPVSL